ncbi:MAG: MBL fold metallo-hydrolase [Synergistaceae bacterium]|jgi:glyoxylase-like metal-dependent hydrolase (beta-lactamase superfamily II)|nr:MBL fold metallo-hydrolase [Synergistaceae bacterium]
MNREGSEFLSPDEMPDDLYLIDLPQPRTGFRHFISSWFFKDSLGRRILVDPGPANTIPELLERLAEITDGVDLVLLTHIHLDHSGGIGQFCERHRGAKVLVHPKAVRHLIDPGKLWRSSLGVLGEVAEMYGEPLPLSAGFLASGGVSGITILETPGHSPHHLSFVAGLGDERLVFVGEAAGLRLPVKSISGCPYLRLTTPPKFDGGAARESLEKIARSLRGDELLCYSHWGASGNSREKISLALRQLDEWMSIISGVLSRSEGSGGVEESIADILIERDPLVGVYSELPADIQERERLFITNSVKGIIGYLSAPN